MVAGRDAPPMRLSERNANLAQTGVRSKTPEHDPNSDPNAAEPTLGGIWTGRERTINPQLDSGRNRPCARVVEPVIYQFLGWRATVILAAFMAIRSLAFLILIALSLRGQNTTGTILGTIRDA